jgi:hypothetical protein
MAGALAAAGPANGATIGMAGGDIDPQSIFDPTPQAVDEFCPTNGGAPSVPEGSFCAEYELQNDYGDYYYSFDYDSEYEYDEPDYVLHSIDFRLRKENGEYFTVDDLEPEDCDFGLCVDTEFSDLDFLIASPLFTDGITFRLYDDSIYCYPGVPDCDAVFFSTHFSPGVSVVGVNGVSTVPEPSLAWLFGISAASLAAARRRRRWTA